MATTVPMLAPDGTSGDIPQDKVQDAIKAGFKQAVEMTSPDGKAGYIPMERQQDALRAGFKAAQPQQPGFLENLGHTFGIGAQEGEQRRQNMEQHPIRTIIQDQPAVQAIQGAYQGGKRILGELGQAGSAALQGNAPSAAVHAITAIPFVGPALNKMADEAPPTTPGQSYGSRVASAATPGNIGTALGTAAQVAPMALGAADAAAPGRPVVGDMTSLAQNVRQYIRPSSSPSVVPRTEMAARQLSAAVLPATKDATNFIQAAQQEVPNVLDYAKRTNNPLNTQLEFSKAAQGYAQEVRDLYENKILGPSENKLVKTTGTGFGDRMQEGPDTYATLGQIDKRIVDINKQLDAPALNSDDARRALASKTELKSEANGLRDILHQNLSQATGLPSDQIADIRQRVGRSYELANDTNAAVTQRMQAEGKTDMGPIHMSQLPSRALEFARGGTANIADRAFQRAISQFPGQATALPTVNPPAPVTPQPQRPSLAKLAGINAEPAPSSVVLESPDAELFTRQWRASDRASLIANRSAVARMEDALQNQRFEQLLSIARQQQKVLRKP